MNIAIIIAGGVGSRMGQDLPKQFINVYDKPVLLYTLEGFQKHPQIDAIELVCIDGWHEIVWAYAKQFNITKLKWIVSGGKTGQESIRNGVYGLEGKANPDDNIIIHDGIRPLVEPSVLSDVISKCSQYGNAVTSMPLSLTTWLSLKVPLCLSIPSTKVVLPWSTWAIMAMFLKSSLIIFPPSFIHT